jgi:tetratricopeptide (TPR) repeat protein
MDLHSTGRLAEAAAVCEQILTLAPAEAGALHLLGVMAAQSGDLKRATELLRRALEINGSSVNAHFNLGKLLWQQGAHGEALASFERAIALRPDFAEAHLHRGYTLRVLERPEEALASFEAATSFRPNLAEAFCGRAAALQDLLRPEEALASYDEAVRLAPDYAQARYNKGLCLLQLGRFEEGWPLAEWRRRLAQPLGARQFPVPLWQGTESLAGKRIVIHPEQGLGDTLQFSRYVRLLLERGAGVTLMVQPGLKALMSDSWPAVRVIAESSEPPEAPDYQCPLLSLPLVFGTVEATIPARVPYLVADAERIVYWRQRLGGPGLKVGVSWQGHPGLIDVGRSFPPAALEPLAAVAGVRLVCLQKLEQIDPALRALAAGMGIELLDEPLDTADKAFFDTAAIMHSLDLVVAPDTAIAHLAGALGRPAWLALRRVPDWRWMLARSDSPWYPTLRLFRQPVSGAWQDVFEAMARELVESRATGQ